MEKKHPYQGKKEAKVDAKIGVFYLRWGTAVAG